MWIPLGDSLSDLSWYSAVFALRARLTIFLSFNLSLLADTPKYITSRFFSHLYFPITCLDMFITFSTVECRRSRVGRSEAHRVRAGQDVPPGSKPAATAQSRSGLGPLASTLLAQQNGLDALSRGVQHAVVRITCVVRTACAYHRTPLHCLIAVMLRRQLRVASPPLVRELQRLAVIARLAALMPVAAFVKCASLSRATFMVRYCPCAGTRSSAGPSAARTRTAGIQIIYISAPYHLVGDWPDVHFASFPSSVISYRFQYTCSRFSLFSIGIKNRISGASVPWTSQ